LQDRVDNAEAERLVEVLKDLRLEVVVHDLPELGMEAVLTTAQERDLTFYDAAHVTCADSVDGTLVTEDEVLRENADEYVDTCVIDTFV